MQKLKKNDLIARASKEIAGVTYAQAKPLVNRFLELLMEQVAKEDRVELRGFGTFKATTLPAHLSVIQFGPDAGGQREAPPSVRIGFRTADKFKAIIAKERGTCETKMP